MEIGGVLKERWTEFDSNATMVRALNVLEDVAQEAKKRGDTDTLLLVAQAFAEISIRLRGEGDGETPDSEKPLGFVHSLRVEEE